jgi:hypothetical protein
MTEIEQAACGRMGYALRCLTLGWRASRERPDLILRVLLTECINQALAATGARLDLAQKHLAAAYESAIAYVASRNPQERPS